MNRRIRMVACLPGFMPASRRWRWRTRAKRKIGLVSVTVYHATNGDPDCGGTKSRCQCRRNCIERMRREERLRFRHYRLLGKDTQPLAAELRKLGAAA